MGTKKINEVITVTDIGDSEYIIVSMSDGSVGKIRRSDLMLNIGRQVFDSTDINELHKSQKPGISVASFGTGGNTNTPENVGLCLNIQRYSGTHMNSTSQIIMQFFAGNKLYVRTGRGNGEDVIYKEWREI